MYVCVHMWLPPAVVTTDRPTPFPSPYTHNNPHRTTAQRLLQRLQGAPSPAAAGAVPPGVDVGRELLVEDCVLEIAGEEGKKKGAAPRRWRSYQVEGPKAEVGGLGECEYECKCE
jgi:hypothetical protein